MEAGVAPVRTGPQPELILRQDDWPVFLANMIAASLIELDRVDAGGQPFFSNLWVALHEIHRGAARPLPCGSAVNYLSLDAEGRFHSCHRTVSRRVWHGLARRRHRRRRPARVSQCAPCRHAGALRVLLGALPLRRRLPRGGGCSGPLRLRLHSRLARSLPAHLPLHCSTASVAARQGGRMNQKIFPRNLTARAAVTIAGNPVTTRLESGVGNCFPGLEFDHRNLDRRFFPGLIFNFGVTPPVLASTDDGDPALADQTPADAPAALGRRHGGVRSAGPRRVAADLACARRQDDRSAGSRQYPAIRSRELLAFCAQSDARQGHDRPDPDASSRREPTIRRRRRPAPASMSH